MPRRSAKSISQKPTTLRPPPSDDDCSQAPPLVRDFSGSTVWVTARKNPTDGDDIKASGGRALHTLPWAAESSFEIAKVERGNPCSSNATGASFGPAPRYKDIEIADLHRLKGTVSGSSAETGLKESAEIKRAKTRFHVIAQFINAPLEKCVV